MRKCTEGELPEVLKQWDKVLDHLALFIEGGHTISYTIRYYWPLLAMLFFTSDSDLAETDTINSRQCNNNLCFWSKNLKAF